MFSAFIVVLLLLIAVGIFALAGNIPNGQGETRSFRWVGFVPLVLAILVLFLSMFTTVDAKNVGVLTTFGKTSERTLDPGVHLKAPWQKNTQLDGTVQTDEYRGKDCIYVRIGDGSRACVTATNRWRIIPDRANTIYGDYRSDDPTESLRDAVVSTQFKAAVQAVMGDYNPVAQLQVVEGEESAAGVNFAPPFNEFAADIETDFKSRLGDDPLVESVSITVSYLSVSESTQQIIDGFIEEVGKTRIAMQQKATATEVAETNATLAESLSNNPGVLVSRCYDLIADKRFTPPIGFSCWPGAETPQTVVPVP